MKILHLITRSEWGGAQKVVWSLAKYQKESGHAVVVMCGEKGRLVTELRDAEVPVVLNPYLLRNPSWKDALALRELKKEVAHDYDLIHAHSSKAGVLARFLGKLLGVPVCFTVHGFGVSPEHSMLKQVLYHSVERFWARWSSALVFVSESNRQQAEERGWLRHARYVAVIPNGIEDMNGRDASQVHLRKSLGIPESAYVVGSLARLAWIKNPDFWLQVARKFTTEFPGSYFIWFGGGEELPLYRERVNTAGLCDRIRFYGEVRAIQPVLQALDVLFFTSHSEGMPLAALEGMAGGLPVLAPDLPEFQELLGEQCGMTYPCGDLQEACFALERLRDSAMRRRLGANARQKWSEKHTVKKMVDEYDKVYRLIITGFKSQRVRVKRCKQKRRGESDKD